MGAEPLLDFVPAAIERLTETLAALGARGVAIERAGPIVWPTRRRKSPAEARPGMTERELHGLLAGAGDGAGWAEAGGVVAVGADFGVMESGHALPHNTGSSPERLQKIRCRGHSC